MKKDYQINLERVRTAYLIGIKGVGMTALAQVLQSKGIKVLGSDTPEKFFTDKVLRKIGVSFKEGFKKENVPANFDLAISSAAYLGEKITNVEVAEVLKRKKPLLSYAQVLGLLFEKYYGIAVAGTHGKSTTTAMLGFILEKAGFEPTVIAGTEIINWQSNARAGQSEYLVAEADEYRESFLNYSPQGLIITNLEYDHPDFFKSFAAYQKAFRKIARKVPRQGFIIINKKDPEVKKIVQGVSARVIEYDPDKASLRLLLPGKHNLLNALAAQAASLELGVSESLSKKALLEFKGIRRRFEIKKKERGITFIDDYAHHPTEIKASLTAARESYPGKVIWAVFQPHTFSRTKALLPDFIKSFDQADKVIILDIYGSAREKVGKVHSLDLVRGIFRRNKNQLVKYIPQLEEAKEYLKKHAQSGDIVLAIGAGDVWKII